MRWAFPNTARSRLLPSLGQWRIRAGSLLVLPKPNLGVTLVTIVFAAVLVGMVGSSVLSQSLQRAELLQDSQIAAERVSGVLLQSLEHAMLSNDRLMIDQMLEAVVGDAGVERVLILDSQGTVHASSTSLEVGRVYRNNAAPCNGCHIEANPAVPPPSMKMLPNSLLNVNVIPNAPACQSCHGPAQRNLGLLLIETPLTALNQQLNGNLVRTLLATIGTFALLAFALLPALRKLVFQPIRRLASAAKAIGSGNLEHPIELTRDDELGELASAFEQMRLQLLHARSEMEERNRELRTLNEVARAASELLDPQQILELSVGLLTGIEGVGGGGIFVPSSECGKYHLRSCRGISEYEAAQLAAHLDATLRRGGLVRPDTILVHPILQDGTGIEPDRPSFMISVPLLARGTEVGRIALVTVAGFKPTDQGIAVLKAMGEEIGSALANALQFQDAQYRATVAERDRLAREMHDSLAQALGYLKLKASITEQLLANGDVVQAQSHLQEVKAIAGETYTDIREAIFCLRQPAAANGEFMVQLETYLRDYRTHYAMDVTILMNSGENTPRFPPDVGLQVMRIVQEALTNVRKHASVKQATIRFALEEKAWHIVIDDNGKGFDPSEVTSEGPHFLGLQIMRERAEAIGGHVELVSQPEHGTSVIVTIPEN
jgi:two-component system, NarL family, nitrate/nitrite sensor histidine kinase NarX